MNIVISDQILAAIRMAEIELKKEIAAMLLGKEKLTFAQASHLV